MIQWRLRSGADRRFRAGHPWVYSNELSESPKGIAPGAPVELRDAGGRFLARGYGNPHSLIAFRAMSREEASPPPLEKSSLLAALRSAGALRRASGLGEFSHRLTFGEADRLPGLVIDRYRIEQGQVFVVQAHTAGMDPVAREILPLLEGYCTDTAVPWEQTAVVLRNNVGARKLEGLEEDKEARVLRPLGQLDLSRATIRVKPAADRPQAQPVCFDVDLLSGQKTGFFLDQAANIEIAVRRFAGLRPSGAAPLKILDLCCYVGQWGAQFARAMKESGVSTQVLAVDASATALELAKRNIEREGARCETLKADVLHGLEALPAGSFDLVISDPPALIKGRKDIPAGIHAYLQLNTQVFRLVKQGGAVVSCSCSGLLEEEEFLKALSKAAQRNHRSVRWIGRGSQSPDHPMLTEFPEGRYLKGWMGFA